MLYLSIGGRKDSEFSWILVLGQLWWNIFDKKGFCMISLGLDKEFLQFCVFLLDFKVNLSNPWRSIRAYTLHQGISLLLLLKMLKGFYKE
jgi:hypothetical protein